MPRRPCQFIHSTIPALSENSLWGAFTGLCVEWPITSYQSTGNVSSTYCHEYEGETPHAEVCRRRCPEKRLARGQNSELQRGCGLLSRERIAPQTLESGNPLRIDWPLLPPRRRRSLLR